MSRLPRSNRSPAAGRGARAAGLLVVAATVGLAGCRQDMHDAPRYDPLEASTVFADGASARLLVEGTVARGRLNDDELLMTGRIGGEVADLFPFAITTADLDRGEERFNIYCAPCHGATGAGDGMVVQRGFRQPPSLHTDRLRASASGYFVDVMTNGFGVMTDYRAQVPVEDRWRIAAYVKALQLTRQGTTADLSAENLARLQAGEVAPAPAGGASESGAGEE